MSLRQQLDTGDAAGKEKTRAFSPPRLNTYFRKQSRTKAEPVNGRYFKLSTNAYFTCKG